MTDKTAVASDTKAKPCTHVVWRGFNVRTLCSKPQGHAGTCA